MTVKFEFNEREENSKEFMLFFVEDITNSTSKWLTKFRINFKILLTNNGNDNHKLTKTQSD